MNRTLPMPVAHALSAFIIGLGLFAAVTPSPLYQAYSTAWQFSPLTLTVVYATYAVGVLATLLLAGSISDRVGRRPVLLVALAGLMASTVLFVFASSVTSLFVARALQGLATGAAISAAGAALLDLHPRRDPASAGLSNAVASSAGIALGVLIASVLVQFGWLPLALPYLVQLALLLIAFAGVIWMPEPVTRERGIRWRVQTPRVPATVRGPFLLAALTVISSWSLGGLFFSLGPALGAALLDSSSAVLSGLGIVALAASATLSQLVLRRTATWLGALVGSAALAVGVTLIVVATAADSGAIFLVGSVVSGVGFGIGFLSGLRALVGAIPAEHRASVMSAYYTVAYLALSLPAVLAGLSVGPVGLERTFEVFGAVVVLVALATVVVAWRARPVPMALTGAMTET
ncbi:MFS transporter [Agromyces badenianii]|uniref:MFS transporter n=1 Tax=Agromyces badenianii TaxID=2080742 RepID=UPI000D591866|nr:MFS transporter [Agromyces badenianii]PWC03500.1 MFS transporter [Agromyces badenianii]